MKKSKRISAIIGIILLVSLYLCTLFSAIFGSPYANGLFLACIFSTFFIPVMIYAMMLIYRIVHKTKDVFSPDHLEENETSDSSKQ